MIESLRSTFENIAEGKNISLSIYDDNDEAQFCSGTSTFSVEDVSAIRNVLKTSCKFKFSLRLKGVNYLCLQTSAGIIYGTGGFNDENDRRTNRSNSAEQSCSYSRTSSKSSEAGNTCTNEDIKRTSSQDVNVDINTRREVGRDIDAGSSSRDGRRPSSKDGDNSGSDSKVHDIGFTNKGYVASESGSIENVHVMNYGADEIPGHEVEMKNLPESKTEPKRTSSMPLIKKRNETKKPTLFSLCQNGQVVECEDIAAMTIYGYTVIVHRVGNGCGSMLTVLSQLTDRSTFDSFCHEE